MINDTVEYETTYFITNSMAVKNVCVQQRTNKKDEQGKINYCS